jgi:hypothetical protein
LTRCQQGGQESGPATMMCAEPALKTAAAFAPQEACGGSPVTLEGTLAIYAIDSDNEEETFQYFLEDDQGKRFLLNIGGEKPRLKTGDRIFVGGVTNTCSPFVPGGGIEYDQAVHVESITGFSTSSNKGATGVQNTLAILLSFNDKQTAYTANEAQNLIFDRVNRFWKEASFEKTSITGKTIGPFTIPLSVQSCNVNQIANLARTAARSAGTEATSYGRVIYIFPRASACGTWYGLATVGGSQAWINGSMVFHTLAHELGHNLGLYHANAWNCGSVTLGSSCSSVEYGDPSSVMGNKVPGHYHAFEKERLGWMNVSGSPEIQLVEETGVYKIAPYGANGNLPGALKILKSSYSTGEKTYYYIEARQASGFDAVFSNLTTSNNLTQGVLVHIGSTTNPQYSYLLNMHPADAKFYKAALLPGENYSDAATGVSILLKSIGSGGAEVSVAFSGIKPEDPVPVGDRSVRIGLDRRVYGEGQVVMAQISSSNLAGGSYIISVSGPNGFVFQKTGVLDNLGGGMEQFQISSCAPRGDYQVRITAGTGDRAASTSTTFQIE